MENINSQDEQIEILKKNRNKVLSKLQQAYMNNIYDCSFYGDDSMHNTSKINTKLCSPIVDDLLMEMNRKRLKNIGEETDKDCCRCKHFLSVPKNFTEIPEQISDFVAEYEADLNFVQAIVWLKSTTMIMKDISVEQFHFILHKQWSDNGYMRTNLGHRKTISQTQKHDCENLSSIAGPNDDGYSDATVDNESECNSIDLLCNVQHKEKQDLSQRSHQQQKKPNGDVFSGEINALLFSQSPKRNETISNKQVIPDSDEMPSSNSDMFNDSIDDECNGMSEVNREDQELREEDDIVIDSLTKEILLPLQGTDLSQTISLELKRDPSVKDTTDFNEECWSYKEDSVCLCSSDHTGESEPDKRGEMQQELLTSDSNVRNENSSASTSQIADIDAPRQDSITSQLSVDYAFSSNSVLLNKDSTLEDNTSPCRKINFSPPYRKDDSAYDTYDTYDACDLKFLDRISDENPLFSLSSRHESDISANQIHVDDDASTISRYEYSYRETDTIENTGHDGESGKKRKFEAAFETDDMIKGNTKAEKRISFEWLRFTLDALSADNVAFQSIKVILSVLQNERIAVQYMRKKRWKDTLEEQAVNAVLNFCQVFEVESKSPERTQEIVRVVTNTLDHIIGNTELNKVTVFTHWISIILELCNLGTVCIETVNHLMSKLQCYESTLVSRMNKKKADVYDIVNQLDMLLYVLNICLQKYRSIFPNKQSCQFETEIVPSVLDLWKRYLTVDDVTVKDTAKTREQRWLLILDNFAVISVENCSRFTEKLRMLSGVITHE